MGKNSKVKINTLNKLEKSIQKEIKIMDSADASQLKIIGDTLKQIRTPMQQLVNSYAEELKKINDDIEISTIHSADESDREMDKDDEQNKPCKKEKSSSKSPAKKESSDDSSS